MPKSKGFEVKSKKSLNFRKWLKTCLDRDDPIGDLARDAFQDSHWKGNSVKSLRERIESLGGHELVIEALELAQDEYSEAKKE